MSSHGRPKDEGPRLAGRRAASGVQKMSSHGRPKDEGPRLAGRRAASGVQK